MTRRTTEGRAGRRKEANKDIAAAMRKELGGGGGWPRSLGNYGGWGTPWPSQKLETSLSLCRGGKRMFPEWGSELGGDCAEGVENRVGGGWGAIVAEDIRPGNRMLGGWVGRCGGRD